MVPSPNCRKVRCFFLKTGFPGSPILLKSSDKYIVITVGNQHKYAINPLPNNKVLDMTKLKAFADDKLNVAKMTIFLFDREEKPCVKRRKCWLPAFLVHLSTGAFRVVRCLLCVVNNFFKHLLANHGANLDQTWQECSLGGPLQKLFTEFDSIKNSGCHGKEIEFFK